MEFETERAAGGLSGLVIEAAEKDGLLQSRLRLNCLAFQLYTTEGHVLENCGLLLLLLMPQEPAEISEFAALLWSAQHVQWRECPVLGAEIPVTGFENRSYHFSTPLPAL